MAKNRERNTPSCQEISRMGSSIALSTIERSDKIRIKSDYWCCQHEDPSKSLPEERSWPVSFSTERWMMEVRSQGCEDRLRDELMEKQVNFLLSRNLTRKIWAAARALECGKGPKRWFLSTGESSSIFMDCMQRASREENNR